MSSLFQHLLFVLSAPDLFGREPPNIQYIKTLCGLQSTHLFHLKKNLSDMNFLGKNIFTCKVNKEPHSLAFKL